MSVWAGTCGCELIMIMTLMGTNSLWIQTLHLELLILRMTYVLIIQTTIKSLAEDYSCYLKMNFLFKYYEKGAIS